MTYRKCKGKKKKAMPQPKQKLREYEKLYGKTGENFQTLNSHRRVASNFFPHHCVSHTLARELGLHKPQVGRKQHTCLPSSLFPPPLLPLLLTSYILWRTSSGLRGVEKRIPV